MTKDVTTEFEAELRSFFVLSLFNMVFGALAMAFGIQFIVTAGVALQNNVLLTIPLFIQMLVGVAAAVLGLRWIRSTVRIFRGVNELRREYRATKKPVSGETLTGLIVRMMAQYRENKMTIRAMTVICALGGLVYLALGITNIFQGVAWAMAPGSAISPELAFLAAGINLTIGLVSLFSSTWFHRYSASWDARLDEANRSEEILKKTLDQETG
jgi:uncharacterized membrane protein